MKRVISYLPTVLVIIGITYVSLLREPSFSLPRFTGADKIAHFLMYAVLSLVFLFDCLRMDKEQKMKDDGRWILIGFVAFALYGGLLEILQERFFSPRTGSWGDWLADVAGCLIGLWVSIWLWKRHKRN